MEKVIRKKTGKALGVLLSAVMIITSVSVGFSAFAAEPVELSETNSVSANTVYTVTADTEIAGSTTENGLSIAENVTVIIDIAEGVTLTVKGGDALNQTAGKAGILLNVGSRLVITGKGGLAVTGGKGGNGANGKNSANANNTVGTGADGGAGGGGGGAGIGTDGGAGGAANGVAGGSTTWPSNASVTIKNTVSVSGVGTTGSSGTAGSQGTQGNGNGAGGAGGGGGMGKGGAAFGTGGGGGKGGAKGSNGTSSTSGCSTSYSKGANGGNGGEGTDATNKDPATGFPFSGMESAINTYAAYYSKTMAELVAIDSDTLNAVKTAINTPYEAMIGTYGADVYTYYFSSYDTETLLSNIEAAIAMAANIALAQWLQEKTADVVDLDASYSTLNTIWSEFNEKYVTFDGLTDETKAFLADQNYIDVSAVEAKLAAYKYAMDVANLRENYYDLITGDVANFSAWDRDWVAETDGATGTLSAAKTTVGSYVTTLNGLDQDAVNYVFGEGYAADVLQPLIEALTDLLYASGLKDRFAGYKSVYDSALAPVNLEAGDDTLYSVLNSYDAWYTELRAYIAALREFDEDFADKVFNNLDTVMQAKIDSIYTALNARLTARVDTAYNYYQSFVAEYGYEINTADDVCVENYTALRQVFNNLNHTQFDFLVASENFTVPEETVWKYEQIKRALIAYEYYDASRGLSAYEFNDRIPVEDITRVITEYDVARNKDYTVDREKRETVYANVRKLLDSDLAKDLLGDGLDLSSLGDTLEGFIFSDSLVNTLISLVYPIVLDNFAPVWATQLPETYPYSQSGFNFSFDIKSNLNTLREALAKLELYALPNQLAAQSVMNAYPEIQAKLAAVTYDPVYDAATETVTVNPWNDPSLVDEDGKLALEWGVHDKESFISALNAGLAGVAPIILALLANKTTDKSVDIKKGTIKDSDTQFVFVTVNVEITEIMLNMSFTGNPGFNNALAPILNVLGAEDLANGNVGTLFDLATCIGNGFEQVIAKLSADPIDFILETLPNLAFALDHGLIMPLLDELKETIKYSATAHYDTDCAAAGSGDISAVDETSIDINLGTMLDLEEMGIDLTTASGLINSIIGLVGGGEEAEPTEPTDPAEPADSGEGEGEGEESSGGILDLLGLLPMDDLFRNLAYWGDYVEWHTGYRTVTPYYNPDNPSDKIPDLPYIVAEPSEVFAHLIDYILDLLGSDEELLPALVDALGLDVDLTDEENLVVSILNKIIADPDTAVAAIVELMIPVDYSDAFREYHWKASDFTYSVPAVEASDVAYLKYANNWTQAKAEQFVEGSGELIDSLMGSLGQEGSLGDMLRGLIGGALNNETVASLKGTLAGLGETLGEDTAALLNDVLGVDLGAFAGIEIPAFEDGDVGGFFNALKALLAPLSPVLTLLFGKDFSALDGVVNIKGYDTYPASVKQLFGALGVEQVAEGTAPEEMLGAILDRLGAKIDALLSGDVVKNILGLLPNVVYFLESEGVGTALYNLLLPVQVVLDVIRPIYDVDLNGLIAGLLPEDVALDLETLTFTDVVAIADDMLGTQLVGTPLTTYAIPALYADKTGDKVGDFTSSVSETDTLTILLAGAVEALEAEASDGVTNGEIIIAKIAGDDAEKQEKYVGMYKAILGILTAEPGDVDYAAINWDYMYGDGEIDLATFTLPAETDPDAVNYLKYENNWNEDVAGYLDAHFDEIVEEIVAYVREGSDLGTILDGLLNDKLYTDDVANAVINLVGGLLGNIEASLLSVADLLLDTDLQNAAFEPVSGVDGKDAFIDALCDRFAPIDRLLAFALFGEGYGFLHRSEDGGDLLAVGGGEAYDMALVPVLEALGVDAPAKSAFLKRGGTYDGSAALRGILEAVAARLEEITADPVNEILALLPGLLYFINADGVKVAVNNALAPFDAIIRLATGRSDGALFDDIYGVPVDDLTTANILRLVENATADENGEGGVRFSDSQKRGIARFYIGEAEKIESANGLPAFRMVYRTGDGATDRRDMITIVVSLLFDVLKYDDNIDLLNKLPVDGLRDTVYNVLFSLQTPERHEIDWYNTDAADTETDFSPIESSKLFPEGFGPFFNEMMARYIADNFGCFVDDTLQLLGVEVDGKYVQSLSELLETYIGTSLFTTENVAKVADALKGYIGQIDSLPASTHIKEVVKRSLGVDLDAFMDYEPGEVNNKEEFINELNEMLTPFAPLFRWLLCDSEISFFCSASGEDQITLCGAEGYNYGVIPILEALFCEDIVEYETFKTLEDDEMIPAILDPILTKLDFILEDPAERMLEILPNVAYFINSNGLDACVKNITGPVQMLLDALSPMIGEISVDRMIANRLGVDSLSEIDVQWLLEVLLVRIEDGTDVELDSLVFDAAAELTAGRVESFTSLNGETAYRMVYAGEDSKAGMVTSLLRLALKWVVSAENSEKLKQLVREKVELSEDGYKYVDTMIDLANWYCNTEYGMNQMLHAVYFAFFSIHTGTHVTNKWLDNYNERVRFIRTLFSNSGEKDLISISRILDYLYTRFIDENGSTGNIFSDDELAPNGLIPLFRQVIEWIRTIIAMLKGMFATERTC